MIIWFATVAGTQDFYNLSMSQWSYSRAPAHLCMIRSHFRNTDTTYDGFYVDFFRNRSTAPAFGEIGDYWFYVDPISDEVVNQDGVALPFDFEPVTSIAEFRVDGVGEVKYSFDEPQYFWVNLEIPDHPAAEWWDVIVNGNYDVTESNYGNNSAELYTGCR